MKHFKSFLSALVLFSASANAASNSVLDSLFRVFDHELTRSQLYINNRQKRIDSLLQKQVTASDIYALNSELAAEYTPYKSQEAQRYIQLNFDIAQQNHDSHQQTESTTRLAYLLASTGNFIEAADMMRPLKSSTMSQSEKAAYFDCMTHIYGEAGFYSKTGSMQQAYYHLSDLYDDSLSMVLSETSARRLKQLESQWRNQHLYAAALAINDSLLALTEPYSAEYAAYAFQRSETYRRMQNQDKQLEWLLRSAIADVRNGITDNGSSWMVAQRCYEQGNLKRAYRYIEYSLNNSNIYGATLRHGQIGPLMSIINNAYQQRLRKQQAWLIGLLIGNSILVVLLLFLFLTIRRRNRKLNRLHKQTEILNQELGRINEQLKQTNNQLRESNHVKEEYIAHYLNLYSEYIDRLKKLKRDPEFMQHEVERFYQVFDTTFLSLYPDFVEEFNLLLRSDSQILPRKGELLNTELRIFALIRLGIDNSAKIAELLRYSANTIYNYRAKIKNMARGSRDDFEDQVRQIGTFTM